MSATLHAAVLVLPTLALVSVWPEVDAWLDRRLATESREVTGNWRESLWRLGPRGRGGWLRFGALLLALAPLPASAHLVGADLDAGLACVLAAGLLALAGAWLDDPQEVTARLPVVAIGGLALALAGVPIVARVSSLNLSDIVIAQQGGLGNWFLWRDPFLLLVTAGYVATAACLVPDLGALRGVTDAAGPAAWTLVTSVLGACLFLGGWWGVVPQLDVPQLGVAPIVHLGCKVFVLAAAQIWLRGRLPQPPRGTRSEPPVRLLLLATLAGAVGSTLWMVLSGEVL